MSAPSYRLLGHLPADAVPERHSNDIDPRKDGRLSQGLLVLIFPEREGHTRAIGVVLDSEGELFSVSDSVSRPYSDRSRGQMVAQRQAVAEFDPDGMGRGYFVSADISDGGSDDGGAIPHRPLTQAEVTALRDLGQTLVRRAPGRH